MAVRPHQVAWLRTVRHRLRLWRRGRCPGTDPQESLQLRQDRSVLLQELLDAGSVVRLAYR